MARRGHALAKAEFATIRLRLIKLGARVIDFSCARLANGLALAAQPHKE
jgi:hypothetical protein